MNNDKHLARMAARDYRRYGYTAEQILLIFEWQFNACAICSTTNFGTGGPVVDHDHATGEVRGILCRACNLALGAVKEEPRILHGMLRYLSGDRLFKGKLPNQPLWEVFESIRRDEEAVRRGESGS